MQIMIEAAARMQKYEIIYRDLNDFLLKIMRILRPFAKSGPQTREDKKRKVKGHTNRGRDAMS